MGVRCRFTLALLFCLPATGLCQPAIWGSWEFRPAKSTDGALWRSRIPRLEIRGSQQDLTIRSLWLEGKSVAMVDSFRVRPGGEATGATVTSQIWPDNWFMGVLAKTGAVRTSTARWRVPLRELDITTDQVVETSQGDVTIRTVREYRLDTPGTTLTVTERRSRRPTPVVMTFERIPEQ